MRARTLCAVYGCDQLVEIGSRCERHRRRSPQAYRRAARRAIERAHGRCERCGVQARLSAHHVRPLIEGGTEIVPDDELLALCASCQQRERPANRRNPN
jgi:5-methylcytosine-specific restriction endonuclease McrA